MQHILACGLHYVQGQDFTLAMSDWIETTMSNRHPNEEGEGNDCQESAMQQRDPEKSTPDKIDTGVNHVATGLRRRNSQMTKQLQELF